MQNVNVPTCSRGIGPRFLLFTKCPFVRILKKISEIYMAGEMQRVQTLVRRCALWLLSCFFTVCKACRNIYSNGELQTCVPLKLDGMLHYAMPDFTFLSVCLVCFYC